MATTITTQATPLSQRIIKITSLSTTPADHVTGTNGAWTSIAIDNSANGHITYLRVWDNVDPTNGTTDPDWIISVAASSSSTVVIPGGAAFSNGISFSAQRDAGTAGTTAPAGAVNVDIVTS